MKFFSVHPMSIASAIGITASLPEVNGVSPKSSFHSDNSKDPDLNKSVVNPAPSTSLYDDSSGVNPLIVGGEEIYTGPATPTPPPTPTPCDDSTVKVDILFDRFPQETTWTLTNKCDGEKVASGGPYDFTLADTLYSERICVPDAEYLFVISDSLGDGICCDYGEGSFDITFNGDEVGHGGDFGSSDEKTFGECLPTPAPISPPTPAPTTPPPTPTPCPDSTVNVNIVSDSYYPENIIWTLFNKCDGEEVASGGYYDTAGKLYSERICVPDAEYLFVIFDPCDEGIFFKSYDLTYNGDEVGHEVGDGDGGTYDHYQETFGECPPTPTLCPDSIVKVDILFDCCPHETTWTLTNKCDGEEVASGGPYVDYGLSYTLFSQRICVPDAKYLFVISDSLGDGICCRYGEGFFDITYNGDKVGHGGDFGSSDEKTFGECESPDLVVAEYDAPRQVSK